MKVGVESGLDLGHEVGIGTSEGGVGSNATSCQ